MRLIKSETTRNLQRQIPLLFGAGTSGFLKTRTAPIPLIPEGSTTIAQRFNVGTCSSRPHKSPTDGWKVTPDHREMRPFGAQQESSNGCDQGVIQGIS